MSREATSWTWEHSEARKTDRLVLLAIADECDSDGVGGHPSQRRLAHLCRCGQSTIRRAIERLEGAGELLIRRPSKVGRGHFSRYAVVMGRDPSQLADELGWPQPTLDQAVVQEWEQLTLEAEQAAARHAADGYEFVNRARKAAPYPLERSGDIPGEDAVENTGTRQTAPGTRQNAPRIAGADPQALISSDPRRPPPVDQVLAGFERPGEHYLSKEELAAKVREIRGAVPRPPGPDGETTTDEEPGQDETATDSVATQTSEPVEDAPGDPGGSGELLVDAWDERKDLT